MQTLYNWIVFSALLITGAYMHAQNTIVILETNQGNIEIALMENVAPIACKNFLDLIERDYYKNVTFHRVIKDFMIQGGDPTGTGRGGASASGSPFEDECSPDVTFTKSGLLAMANAGPKTNGSQFFITTTENASWLNGKHTIFGEVISGMDVVRAIEAVETSPVSNKPLTKQVILKAYKKKA